MPERSELLAECVKSVQAQTFPDWEHLVLVDEERVGCSRTVNALVREARGEWLFILADDDLLLPGCLQHHLDGFGDIRYSRPLVWGEDPAQFHAEPPWIPSAVLIRKETWEFLGGYDERLDHQEDRDLYERAVQRNLVFGRVDYPCWVYRFWKREDGSAGNKSRG